MRGRPALRRGAPEARRLLAARGGAPSGTDARSGARPDVFVTRLHVRYDAAHFPEDLVFQETADRANFQGRYVLRHAFTGEATCEAGKRYRQSLAPRGEKEAATLASLTGWPLEDIRRRIGVVGTTSPAEKRPWWKTLFGD